MREYEAEDEEMRRKTASGLWNKKMSPSANARMELEEKAEIKKLTDAIRGQVREERLLKKCNVLYLLST